MKIAELERRVGGEGITPEEALWLLEEAPFDELCEAEHIYVVTLSGNLSGSYNSAMVGRQMYLEEDESKQIYVMDSCSASCGETQLALLAASLEEQGLSFEEVVSRLEAFRSEMNTYFVNQQMYS